MLSSLGSCILVLGNELFGLAQHLSLEITALLLHPSLQVALANLVLLEHILGLLLVVAGVVVADVALADVPAGESQGVLLAFTGLRVYEGQPIICRR